MAANTETEVIAARANGLYPHYPKSGYVLARRRGEALQSEFVAAVEPYGAASKVMSVERLALEPAAGEIAPVAVKVTLRDGTVDFVYSADDDTPRRTPDGIAVAGRFVHARTKDGRLEGLTVSGVREFSGFGKTLKPETATQRGTVTAVDVENNVVTTAASLPADGSLDGAVIYFSNPGYTRNTAYRIDKVETAETGTRIFLHATVGLGFGRVEAQPDARTLTSSVPHEYANSVRRASGWGSPGAGTGSGFFNGKRIRSASGAIDEDRLGPLRHSDDAHGRGLERVQARRGLLLRRPPAGRRFRRSTRQLFSIGIKPPAAKRRDFLPEGAG